MDIVEQAKYIDIFLKFLYDSSFPESLATGIEMRQLPSEQNRQKFKTLEYIIEELGLVEFIQGRDNSTIGGQCEYSISGRGRELVESNTSSFQMLLQRDIEKYKAENLLFDEDEWDKNFHKKIKKRAEEADFYFDILISEGLIKMDNPTIKKHFMTWFKETQDFDLQIKNGDLAIEDGDLQVVPDFDKSNILEFMKDIESKKYDFLKYYKEQAQGQNIEPKTKEQTINNYMGTVINNIGDGNVLNTGNNNTFDVDINIAKGDLEKLVSELQKQGIEKEDIDELVQIVNNEQPNNNILGEKAQSWIFKILGKSFNGVGKIAVGISSNLLATLIKSYYGIV